MNRFLTGVLVFGAIIGTVSLVGVSLPAVVGTAPNQRLAAESLQSDALAQQAADGASALSVEATPKRFSKPEFETYVLWMTKAELRQRFGSPKTVHGDGTWTYFNLPVYDDEAGIRAPWVNLKFAGMGGMQDEIVEVYY